MSSKNSKNNNTTNEKNEEKAEDSPYESMVRSLTNRGKNKRKVKLVEDKLIQLTFADHSDSEDDEDFTLDDADLDSDDSNFGEGDDGDSDGDEEEENEDGAEEEENETSQDEEQKDEQANKPLHIGELIKAMKANDQEEADSTILSDDENESILNESKGNGVSNVSISSKKVFLVCGICLEADSNESDEILECDNCGITVHEGCYGDIDTPDDNASESDAPTEPWFCEPCKAGLTEAPICELCPNVGGIFKLTDTRKWVHLICALYTPYVGFRDISKLQTVVLEDIRSSMWGAHECMFCLDDNFSRTGVCISCDAGLCKSAFHVTCGQRNGFLSDIPDKAETDDNSPDLLYAHCKLHSVKQEVETRKSSWLTFQSHVEKFQPCQDDDEKDRIDDSLKRAKKDFMEYQRNIIQPKQPDKEYARFLSTCPEACKLLAKKADILGLLKHPGYNVAAAVTKGKITKHEPNLSSEFVNYFFKREMESTEITQSLKTAEPRLNKLRKEQRVLTKKSEEYHGQLEQVRKDNETLIKSCENIFAILYKLSNKKFNLPEMLRPNRVKETKGKLDETTKLLNTVVNRCATCQLTTDQHLLALCDTCKQHYHLACLDPPLLRMPKKSGNYLWQCTECDSSDESESEVEILDDINDGMRRNKRRNTRQPTKFTPEEPKKDFPLKRKNEDESGSTKPKKLKKKVKKPKENSEKKKESKTPPVKKERLPPVKKEKPPLLPLGDCCICNKPGDRTNIVKCDECLKFYHFQTCLDPPYSKTPKSKFYGWICEECDETDEDYVEDEENESGKEVNGTEHVEKDDKTEEKMEIVVVDDNE
eukprot:TCONS_00054945-protein